MNRHPLWSAFEFIRGSLHGQLPYFLRSAPEDGVSLAIDSKRFRIRISAKGGLFSLVQEIIFTSNETIGARIPLFCPGT
jgi:hypothetical protein